MYAVIKTGGKQYKVAVGEKIKVEQIAADVGQEIVIDQVLAVGNGAELTVGTPLVAGATVKATVVAQAMKSLPGSKEANRRHIVSPARCSTSSASCRLPTSDSTYRNKSPCAPLSSRMNSSCRSPGSCSAGEGGSGRSLI